MSKKNFLVCSLLGGLLFLMNTGAQAFNNSNFKGNYAFRLLGPSSLVSANEPLTVSTGIVVADGNGHVTGHGSFRSAGVTCKGTIVGNYNIKADGTGVLSSTINTSTSGCTTSVLDLALVLSNQGVSLEAANTENDYLSGTFTRQNKMSFKQSDFSGSYALRLVGPSSLAKANEPLTVGVAQITSDGKRKVTGYGTLRSAGATCHGSFTGIYLLNMDGTGSISSNFASSDPGCFPMVVDLSVALFNKGNGAEVASSENDYLAGTLKRQILK